MGALQALGLILLIIGVLLLFGPFILSIFGLGGILLGGLIATVTWLPGLIFIFIGAWLYRKR